MAIWTLEYNGVEKTCAAWGLTAKPVIRTRDRSETVFSFWMAGAAPGGAVPFPFQARVILRQNRTAAGGGFSGTGFVFTGYMQNPKAVARGGQQGFTITFADAIWLMKSTPFQQVWKALSLVGGVEVPDNFYFSRCVLFMDVNTYIPNLIQSVQWQLNQIIAWAQTCGIAIQPGVINYSGWFLNYYHCRAVSIWDAFLKCLEPIPDAKVWVDGSTVPPSLNVLTRATIAGLATPVGTAPGPVTLPFQGADAAGRRHFSSPDFTPRYDLQLPCVVLQYQTTSQINGTSVSSFSSDIWPANDSLGNPNTGAKPFALVAPIDLSGAIVVNQTGHLDCEPLACVGGTQATKRAWWAAKRGGEHDRLTDFRTRFQDVSGNPLTIPDATVVDDNGNPINLAQYPNRIVKGTYHAWMANASGGGINAIRAHILTTAQCAEYDVAGSTPAESDTNGNVVRKSAARQLHCHITLTNAPAGANTFNAQNVKQLAETAVAGLAQNIFISREVLDYDGSHEIVDPGITGETIPLAQIIGPWNVLNFTGGNPAWLTANMTVAGSEIDLVTNHQRIEVGPSKHLQPQDWNSMLQFFRYRRLYLASSQRGTGTADANNTIDEALNTPDANTVEGLNVDSSMQLLNYTNPADPTSAVVSGLSLDTTIQSQLAAL